MKWVMAQIDRKLVDQIIILDGQSKDGTVEWSRAEGYDVYVQKEKGLWNAYTELFNSGLIKGDIVITFSPDGNSIPEAIPELIKAMEDKDMVIASRYKGYAVSEDDTKYTGFGNHLLTWLVNLRSSFKYTDALVMYRAYRVKYIKELGFLDKPNWLQKKLIKMSGLFSYEPSLSIRMGRKHLRIGEIPASEPKAYRERRETIWTHGFMLLMQILYEGWLR
jgi:glycosyltransferase involved in cell wall biosynthesis